MEVTTNESRASIDPNVLEGAQSKIKQKLGQVGRRIKKIDLREKVVAYPFAAVGIGLAAGALVGLVRPKPQPGRVTSALMTVAAAIAFRLMREAAVKSLGAYAKDFLSEQLGGKKDDADSFRSRDTVAAPF